MSPDATPGWLHDLLLSPMGAEVAVQARSEQSRQDFLQIYNAGRRKLANAQQQGNLDPQYVAVVFPEPARLLHYAMATEQKNLILRPRTVKEANQEFPQPENPDGSKNFVLATSADMEPQAFIFDLSTNSGPMIVVAKQEQQANFFTTLEQSANFANRPNRLKVFRNKPAMAEYLSDQLVQRAPLNSKNILIASIHPQTSNEELINLGWISRMKDPAVHLVLGIEPDELTKAMQKFITVNNKIDVLPDKPTTLQFSDGGYFILTDAANPQGRKYFATLTNKYCVVDK